MTEASALPVQTLVYHMFVIFKGWCAAAEIAGRAVVKFQSPVKRKQVATFLTVDQVE